MAPQVRAAVASQVGRPCSAASTSLRLRPARAVLRGVTVEYLDADGRWRPLEDASAVRLEPGVYEVTLSRLSPTCRVRADTFDGTVLRVDGLETREVIGTRIEGDRIYLRATARERS